jgi:threonine dehydratase
MVSLQRFNQAKRKLASRIIRTPLIYSPTISRLAGAEVYLKLENLQKTGSFKIRGATYKLIANHTKIGSGGVVTASAGNHAQGVALAARTANLPATIVMPEWTSISKQQATRAYGGNLIVAGSSIEESLEKAKSLAESNRTFIHPYDDLDIITGQGTIALEIFEDINDVNQIIVPVGGGGLIAGIAEAAKTLKPDVGVIGVQAEACPSAYRAMSAGEIVRVPALQSVADGISVKAVGTLTFEIIRQKVREIALVTEEEIAAAMLMLLERKKVLAEGAGAASLAALLNGGIDIPCGSKVVLVISGGNVDSPLLGRIMRKGLLENGRIMRIRVKIQDIPGSLAALLKQIAALRANVLHIRHDRDFRDASLYVSRVELELETRGQQHVKGIVEALEGSEYELEWE